MNFQRSKSPLDPDFYFQIDIDKRLPISGWIYNHGMKTGVYEKMNGNFKDAENLLR